MKNKLTIKIRLTLWYIIILTVILAVFSVFIYWSMEQYMFQQVETMLRSQARQIVDEFKNKGKDEKTTLSETKDGKEYLSGFKDELKEMQTKDMIIGIYDMSGRLISDKHNDIVLPNQIISTAGYQKIEDENSQNDKDWTVLTIPIKQEGQTVGWIRLARSLENEEQILDRLMMVLFLGIPLILLIATSGGYFLSWKALSPIDRIIRTARDISHNNLGQRIEEMKTRDEVGRLTDTLNQLLDRLEKAFNREKQFTADASHELRTPVTVIRAQAEKALRNKNIDDEYYHILEVIEKQAEYMSHLIDQLLLLARSDIDQQILEKEEFDLNELIRMVADEITGIAAEKNIKLDVDIRNEEINIYADQRMFIQLLLNLLDNAVKYTLSGGRVIIMVEKLKDDVKIQVVDTGLGIPQEDQENIFERFYRVDKARSRKKGGTGLGLAICSWIVEAHGGEISVKSRENEGSVFTIIFPDITA